MSNGYFAFRTQVLGRDVIWDIHFDSASPEPAVGYSGYFSITRVKWNNVELLTYDAEGRLNGPLTKEDLKALAEDVQSAMAYQARRIDEDAIA